MQILFFFLWSFVLLIPQLIFRIHFGEMELGLKPLCLLVMYIGFVSSLYRGLILIVGISYLESVFSHMSFGYFFSTYVVVFLGIQLLMDRLYTEAYLTKSLWLLPFTFLHELITLIGWGLPIGFAISNHLWIALLLQTISQSLLSLPLFMILDRSLEGWLRLTSRPQAHLTGADLYQVKSQQRKYL